MEGGSFCQSLSLFMLTVAVCLASSLSLPFFERNTSPLYFTYIIKIKDEQSCYWTRKYIMFSTEYFTVLLRNGSERWMMKFWSNLEDTMTMRDIQRSKDHLVHVLQWHLIIKFINNYLSVIREQILVLCTCFTLTCRITDFTREIYCLRLLKANMESPYIKTESSRPQKQSNLTSFLNT